MSNCIQLVTESKSHWFQCMTYLDNNNNWTWCTWWFKISNYRKTSSVISRVNSEFDSLWNWSNKNNNIDVCFEHSLVTPKHIASVSRYSTSVYSSIYLQYNNTLSLYLLIYSICCYYSFGVVDLILSVRMTVHVMCTLILCNENRSSQILYKQWIYEY